MTQAEKQQEVTPRRYSFDADDIQHPPKRAFLAAYAETANVAAAARTAGIHRTMHYHWLEHDEAYARAFSHAHAEAIERAEREVYRRAIEGYEHPVWYQGEQIGTERRFSDNLAMFFLKGAKPDTYRDNARVEVAGQVNHAHAHLHAQGSQSDLMALLEGQIEIEEGESDQAKQVESRAVGDDSTVGTDSPPDSEAHSGD